MQTIIPTDNIINSLNKIFDSKQCPGIYRRLKTTFR